MAHFLLFYDYVEGMLERRASRRVEPWSVV
jgi:hypothetical protein